MRLELRWFAILLAAGSAGCSDTGQSPAPRVARGVRTKATVSLAPVFAPAAAAVYAQRSTFTGLNFDRVRVAIVRPPLDTLADTTVVFTPSSPDLTLDLTVEVIGLGETFSGVIQYINSDGVVFEGRFDKLLAHAPDEPPPQQPAVVVSYVGPGFNATRLVVSPKSTSVTPPGRPTFIAIAFDGANTAIPNVPIAWTSSDPSLATISDQGVLSPTGKRGTVTITARTPTNLSDNATATIVLPIGGIALVSGGGQTGRVGSVLPVPATVRVTATDGVAVGGASVSFVAPGGGKVGTPVATTDGGGGASTTLTLANTAGTQTFAATTSGFTVNIVATATAGDAAAISAVSGSGQSDSVLHTLKSPFVVKVTDAFANAVPGIVVDWSRTGTGTLGAQSSITDATGLAGMTYTLGPTPGTDVITASTSGVTGSATFQATAAASCTLALSINRPAAGTVTGAGTFPCGSTVTIGATANAGYAFSDWRENGQVFSTSGSTTFALLTNRTLIADFISTGPPLIVVSPTSVTFSMVQCDGNPPDQALNVSNGGGGVLSGLSASWVGQVVFALSVKSISSTTAPSSVVLSAAIDLESPITFTLASVHVASPVAANSPVNIPATIVISPRRTPTIGASPASLSFSASKGGANPSPQTVSITNSASTFWAPGVNPFCELAGLALGTVTYGGGASGWLSVGALGNTNSPASFTVQATTGTLAAGTYTATIAISASAATNTPLSVLITFTVH